jgi:hypothetical protein
LRDRSIGQPGKKRPRIAPQREQDDLDPLKGLSNVEARGRDPVYASLVTRQVATGSSFLFGFSKELLPLETRDTDFMFTTTLGRLVVKAHFLPKEMLYHGELAV